MANIATPDILLAIVILLSAVIGMMRGLVKEVLSLVIWGAALVASLYFGDAVGERIGADMGDALRGMLGFSVVFIAVLVAGAIAQRLVARLIETTGLSGADRLLGFLFGSARGIVVCTVALVALRPFAEDTQWWRESNVRPELMKLEEGVLAVLGQTRGLMRDEVAPEPPEPPEPPELPELPAGGRS